MVLTVDGFCSAIGEWRAAARTPDRAVDIDGTPYSDGYQITGYCNPRIVATAAYVLGADFAGFEAQAGVVDDSDYPGPIRVQVVADGSVLRDDTVQVGSPVDLDLDVDGVVRLEVRFFLPVNRTGNQPTVGVSGGVAR